MIFKAAVFILSPLLLFGATKTTSHASKSSSKASSGKSKTSKHSSTHSRRGKGKRHAAGPSYQTHPTEDRYKEIQQALAEKGYFKGQVDGHWDADSVDSLKRFQTDHQISNDGKINSLSLMQLGLGPKRDSGAATPSRATPNAAAPSPEPAGVQPSAPTGNPIQNLTTSQ